VTVADQVLSEELAPYVDDDDGSLVAFTRAVYDPLNEADAVARPSDTDAGWSAILDVNRAPVSFPRWLGQFVGVSLPRGFTELSGRQQIATPAGWKRGTPDAIRAAVQPLLTGSQTVLVLERTTDAHHFTVATFTDETPDTAAVTAAVNAQKPAGLIVSVITIAHWVYITLITHDATYSAVTTEFATYNALKAGP
jgi:hypothetical protein